jgi:NAD-dependent DNA ligase
MEPSMSSIPHDDHGQPVTTRLRRAANQTRNINELIGICRGIAFDNQVTQDEAVSLAQWLYSQPDLLDVWPASILYERLCDVLADGVVDQKEARDLLDLLKKVIGGEPAIKTSVDFDTGEFEAASAATDLPVTDPGIIHFDAKNFVLTGKFASGTRSDCEAEILRRGGFCLKNPTKKTHYLVIGEVGSRDWIHSSWGRKIEKAVELRNSGIAIEILSERHWVSFLK